MVDRWLSLLKPPPPKHKNLSFPIIRSSAAILIKYLTPYFAIHIGSITHTSPICLRSLHSPLGLIHNLSMAPIHPFLKFFCSILCPRWIGSYDAHTMLIVWQRLIVAVGTDLKDASWQVFFEVHRYLAIISEPILIGRRRPMRIWYWTFLAETGSRWPWSINEW